MKYPDKKDCDTWQVLKRLILNQEIAASQAKGPTDSGYIRATTELSKLEGGEDPSLTADVAAILKWRGFQLPGLLKKAMAREKNCPETEESVGASVEALKQKLKQELPQVTGLKQTA